jgi:hypothetical protein
VAQDGALMALKSAYETRCGECGGDIKVGDEINYFAATASLKAESRHVVCPERKLTKTIHARPAPAREVDRDGLFTLLKCCGQVTAVRKGVPVPASCPCCSSEWSLWEAA